MASDGEPVEYCVNNVTIESRSTLLEADVPVRQQHCLRHCGVCHERPFVIRGGELIRAECHETLVGELTARRSNDE